MGLHDTVDPLVIGRISALLLRLAHQKSMHASVAIGRQVADNCLDRLHQIRDRQRRTASAMFERATCRVAKTVLIANRPWATTASAAAA